MIKKFRDSQGFNAIVLSPEVAGVGLTLVEANHVIHYGRWWNPAVESQATDRVYRIGQTKHVTVYLPILRDPHRRIDASFDECLDQKGPHADGARILSCASGQRYALRHRRHIQQRNGVQTHTLNSIRNSDNWHGRVQLHPAFLSSNGLPLQ